MIIKRMGFAVGIAFATSTTSVAQSQRLTNRPAETRFVDSVLARMTLAEKLGKLNQVSGAGNPTGPGGGERGARMDQLRQRAIGSFLTFVGVDTDKALPRH